MATYCTDAEVLAKWAAVLLKHTGASSLPSGAATIAGDANLWAYGAEQGALQARGFSLAQVDAWDRAREFNLDLACWYCLRDGATADAEKWIKDYDRREDLKTVVVISGGAWTDALTPTRRFGSGPLSTAGDRFTMHTRW